ncbi:helix-turn-helix domain-containing protein [Streptomyces sp. NPDC056405]|uniref:helix-turn-helix domain-containing protein n=1 Tax=Streptomyces sp. NPDC056405 TaxID=3345811 RepID=UPI0035DE661D
MKEDVGWLELLVRDAPAEDFTALGAELSAHGRSGPEATATALQLKSLLQQRGQRAGELRALNDIAGRLSTLHDPGEVLAAIVEQARRLLRVDLAYLGLSEQEPEPAMRVAVASGALTTELIGLRVPQSASLAGDVIRNASPRWVSDYRTSAVFRHDETADAAAVSENMRGLLGVPLEVRGRVIGALFACKRSERHFTTDEVALLSGLAAHAAVAIDNARGLERLAAARDELAGRTAELERTVAWNQRLTQLVLRGGGVDDLLTEIASVAAAPVRLVRHDGGGARDVLDHAIATAAAGGPADEPIHTTLDDRHLVMRRVMAGHRDFGVLAMTSPVEPSPEDVLVVDQAAPVMALALVAEDAVAEAGRYARDSLLAELLTTSSTDTAGRRQLARRAGLDLTARYFIVVVDPEDGLSATRQRLQRLSWPSGTAMAGCRGQLVVLVPAGQGDVVHHLWKSRQLPTAGLAGPTSPGPEIAECYREAVETMEALTALGLTGAVRTADQLGLFRVLLNHAGRRQIEAAFERALARVRAEEDTRGVPLLETLECFLAEGRRPRPAARALGIHVNTLYQRLTVLDRLIGDRWREPEQALELQLLLRLRHAVTAFDANP